MAAAGTRDGRGGLGNHTRQARVGLQQRPRPASRRMLYNCNGERVSLELTGLPGAPTGPICPMGPGRPGGPYGGATEKVVREAEAGGARSPSGSVGLFSDKAMLTCMPTSPGSPGCP